MQEVTRRILLISANTQPTWLDESRYIIEKSNSIEHAVQAVERLQPDCVLVDNLSALNVLRQRFGSAKCEYILLTPSGDVSLDYAVQSAFSSRDALASTAEELQLANHDLERFAYIASHDLQEPLRSIMSFSELFLRRNKDFDDESRQYLDYVRQGGHRMQELIADLLTFSRVLQSEQEPMEQLNCNDVMAEAMGGLKDAVSQSGAEVNAANLPWMMASFDQMTQLFRHLIGNAIKFRSTRKPVVGISATDTDAGWQFCVVDNGIGFEMIYASHIFEAFRRLHSRDQYAGSGLGLAICKRIVNRHGGHIWAESVPGDGSRFFFTVGVAS